MATYADMQARIADELDRPDLTSQIQKAIQDAIGFYERRYFYFTNEPLAFSFNTVAGQEYYDGTDAAAIPTAAQIIQLTGTFYGLRRQLHKQAWEYLDSLSTTPVSRAMPQDFAYAGEKIRLYPIPDAVYPISAYAAPRLSRPSADGDAGVWMNDAEELIRTRAKKLVLMHVVRDQADLPMLELHERQALAALSMETGAREGTGHLMPVHF